jgi:starch phosphorylase
LPEALEKWPVQWFKDLFPRHLEIIYEINRRFLDDVRVRHPGDEGRIARVSLIEEGANRQVRMAHLAIVGSHSTNGVAGLHSELLKKRVVPDFAAMFPGRFNNKTNGVTPRRWLLLANPSLATVITDAIGDGWVGDLAQLEKLKALADDTSFCTAVRKAKRDAKSRFLRWLDLPGIDPDSMFDTQIKRIHEYKRQLLNALHVVVLYHRLRESPQLDVPPRTFFFAGKAAPAYHFAKLVIKFINNLAGTLDGDPVVQGRLKVVFVPDYRVSVAEYLIPASDVSEQISTAGYEASGTSNMKFMMNGALTIGTRDGATIEMAEAAGSPRGINNGDADQQSGQNIPRGEENFFLFGLNAEQVEGSRGWYNPRWHHENEPETRAALDLIASNHFSRSEPGIFTPILDALLQHGDHYRHLADLASYAQAHQRLGGLYADQPAWTRKAILNIAASGRFSSDRTIAEYAGEIWKVQPCQVS